MLRPARRSTPRTSWWSTRRSAATAAAAGSRGDPRPATRHAARRRLESDDEAVALQRRDHVIGAAGDRGFRQCLGPVAELPIGELETLVFGHRLAKAMPAIRVAKEDLRPGRRHEDTAMEPVPPCNPVEATLARGVFERRRRIDQAAIEEHRTDRPASRVQSCSAIATARRAKATGSSQGKADPPVRRSSATMRRPGSSTTRWPRRASSARRVDLPPPEQPEMMTKSAMVSCRFRLRLPDEAGPPRGWRNRRAGKTPTNCGRRDDGCRSPAQIPGSELWIRVSGGR